MLLDWGTRLLTILALLTTVAGLVILALPDSMEGEEVIHLNASHGLRVADLIGAVIVGLGAILTWVAVLAWQRRRIEP